MAPRLLILDLNPPLRRLLLDYFDTRGFGVEAVDALATAQLLARREAPDIVLVDELLIDEPTLTWLDALAHTTHPPALVLMRVHQDRHELLDQLPWGLVLDKPFTPRDLFGHVLRLLDRQTTPQEPIEAVTHRVQPLNTVETPAARAAITPALRMAVTQASHEPALQEAQAESISVGPPPSSSQATNAQRLHSVRHVYSRRLPGLLAALRRGLDAARAGDVLALDEARRTAQQLRGTSGSFGFSRTAESLGELGILLDTLDRTSPPDHEAWARVDRAFQTATEASATDSAGPSNRPAISTAGLPAEARPPLQTACEALGLELVDGSPGTTPFAIALGDTAHPLPPTDTPLLLFGDAPSPEGHLALRVPPNAQPQVIVEALLALQRWRDPAHLVLLSHRPASTPSLPQAIVTHAPLHPDALHHAASAEVVLIDGQDAPELALHLLRALRQDLASATVPSILRIDTLHAAAGLRAGADVVLPLDSPPDHIALQVTRLAQRQRLLAQPTAAADVHSAHAFFKEATTTFERARRLGLPCAIVTLGLLAHDELTAQAGPSGVTAAQQQLARLMRTQLRASDLRGHWPHDRFALLLIGEPATHAQRIADRLVQAANTLSIDLDGRPIALASRANLARSPEHGTTLLELLTHVSA